MAREKEKVIRYMNIKERNGQSLEEREIKMRNRIRDIEKKATLFEKQKRESRKNEISRFKERHEERQGRREKAQRYRDDLDEKAWQDYKKVVAISKKRMKKELDT